MLFYITTSILNVKYRNTKKEAGFSIKNFQKKSEKVGCGWLATLYRGAGWSVNGYNRLQRSFETLQAPYTSIKAYNRRYPLIHEIHRLGTY
jgi:hypothetical protein